MKNETSLCFPLLGLDYPQLWTIQIAYTHLSQYGYVFSKRTAERRILEMQLLPSVLKAGQLTDEFDRPLNRLLVDWVLSGAHKKRERVFFAQISLLPNGLDCLHFNDARGGRFWIPLGERASILAIEKELLLLQQYIGKSIIVFSHGSLVGFIRGVNKIPGVKLCQEVYQPNILVPPRAISASNGGISPHLRRLESESIHIIREALAEAKNPVMMYSVGKDSGVMLYLARKAFFPAPPPFPLLHIDTRWKFKEMYQFRDYMVRESGMQLLTYVNPEAIEKNINPFDHGSSLHTDITKTEGLKKALDHYEFDLIFGGARRDEEKSRAKERIFSFRTSTHQWVNRYHFSRHFLA
jgi:sulfate adenylyltransferase subunit 2